jgi:2',3'-cyclic-nucleotide 2'-phosphodiesterase (5'-nucleotidase family)
LNRLRVGIYQDPRFGPVYSQHVAKARWDHEETWVEGDPYREPSHMDTPLGNLVADAIRSGVEDAGYPVDFALEVNGYIGHKIYAGKVVGNDVMRALPYGFDPVTGLGFKIKTVWLYGYELLGALEYTVSEVENADDLSLQVSGLTFEFNSENVFPVPRIDPFSIRINGFPFDFMGQYTIALNEKLYEFLHGLLLPLSIDISGRKVEPSPGLFEFNLVKDYMQDLNHLRYTSEGRIIDTSKE